LAYVTDSMKDRARPCSTHEEKKIMNYAGIALLLANRLKLDRDRDAKLRRRRLGR